jgi:Acetyltransferases
MKLISYEASFESTMLNQIAAFFGFHHNLTEKLLQESLLAVSDDIHSTLEEWQIHPNQLFVITENNIAVGFIRINFRGDKVAWIEDVFVDTDYRGKGLASSAISAVESIVKNTPGYTAVCLDVSPRNINALHLYHKLGYTDLSLITMRKEFGESKRNLSVKLFDLDFNY